MQRYTGGDGISTAEHASLHMQELAPLDANTKQTNHHHRDYTWRAGQCQGRFQASRTHASRTPERSA